MKRFNTERIRQRMREQNDRLPHSKGKLLSAFQSRGSVPPQTDKENQVPVHGENKGEKPSLKDRRSHIPQLSISVTMSEPDEDTSVAAPNTVPNDASKVSDEEEDNNTLPSVWAMMEHYQGASKDKDSCSDDRTPSKLRIVVRDNNDGSVESNHTESVQSDTTQKHAENITGNEGMKIIPNRIHWLEDDDGELVQSSFYTNGEVSEIDRVDELEASQNDLSTVNENDTNAVFRTDPNENGSPMHSSLISGRKGQPTPARVRQEWVASDPDEDLSTNPESLLQESMIQSIHLSMYGNTLADTHDAQNDSESQASLPSLPGHKWTKPPAPSSSEQKSLVIVPETSPPVTKDNEVYDRLGELESHLKAQQNNTDQVQGRLKERVMELEQALKASVATPRGTIVDENPLKTLLDRNQTLVKEVRFADQTCVELSSKIRELEMKNERLQKQLRDSENKENMNSQKILEKETKIADLEQKLIDANATIRAKEIEDENIRTALVRAFESTSYNEDALGLSSASSIVSESMDQNHSMNTTVIYKSKTLQQQVNALVERAKLAQNMEETVKERDELRTSNDALTAEVNRLQNHAKLLPIVTPKDNSKKLEQLQKENEFLGRQLGMVQEKLDKTQTDLSEECDKSASLRMHVERGVETYRRLIEPLERRLTEVTKYNPKHKGIEDADKRLFSLEKELAHAKASITAMKRESDRLLAVPAISFGTAATMEQEQKIVSMVQATVSRMGQYYKDLEADVEKMVDDFSDRLEELTATVSHLRSSLLFEKDSVSSDETDSVEEDQGSGNESTSHSKQNAPNDLMSATIPYPVEDEDELFTLMEEARAPRTHDISISSDLDDISRLLHDDMTLESIVRTGSVYTSGTNMEMFKESLETAMAECKRVKDRSLKLKEQITSQQSTIEKLEQENGKLSLNISRRNEEYSLLEDALTEAKEKIHDLESTIGTMENENEVIHQQLQQHDTEGKVIQEENERLTKSAVQLQKEKDALELRVSEYEKSLALLKGNLEAASTARDDYQSRFDDLQSQISTKILKVTEHNQFESAETRRALQMAINENSELERLYHEASTKLSKEVESKLKLEAIVKELENFKLQAQSDMEDRDLESQFVCEDMRKERAELRHRLSQTENESAKLKESYSSFKAKAQSQLEEKSRLIKELEMKKNGLVSSITQLYAARSSFNERLQSLGCCGDVLSVSTSEEYLPNAGNQFESAMKEIACWKDILPLLEDEIESMFHSSQRIPELGREIEELNEELSKREIKEMDQKKHTEEQSAQNEKLFDLLRQAEEEMERSTHQIQEMATALAATQQREMDSQSIIKVLESELVGLRSQCESNELEKNEDLNQIKRLLLDASSTLETKDAQILEMSSQINDLKSEINDTTMLLRSKESDEYALKNNIDTCEKKNSRLREYIRKLTTKCEEWESSYDRQSRTIDRLQEKNARIKEKACEIASRYRALAADVHRRKKSHQHDREKWSHERSNLNSVHAALEHELEQIAKELA